MNKKIQNSNGSHRVGLGGYMKDRTGISNRSLPLPEEKLIDARFNQIKVN